jgi:multidrug efflux system membrane fusion protein
MYRLRGTSKMIKYISLACCLLLIGCQKKEIKKPPAPTVKVQSPIVKTVPIYIETVGHVQPIQTVNITPQATGQIVQLTYEEGTYVNQGDILAFIDNRPYLAQKHQVLAELAQNQASLKYARDTLIRNTPLVREDFISKNNYENLTTNVLTIEAQIEENMAELESAEINLNYCMVKAPISGLLGQKQIDVGNVLTANANQVLVTINQMDPIWVNFSVPEKTLSEIRKQNADHPVKVELYEQYDKPLVAKGTLDFIDNTVSNQTGMIVMKGIFENIDFSLWPGQFFKVKVILNEIPNAILVPSKAVQYGQNGPFVFRLTPNSTAEVVLVSLGQRHGDHIVVLKGLSSHDLVITQGQVQVHEGVTVHSIVDGVAK